METNNSQPETRELDELEQLIAEIVADPEVRAKMLGFQLIDAEMN